MNVPLATDILSDIISLLGQFQGLEYSDPIDRNTRFFADLGLASIDAIVLGEALETHYGRSLPFGTLMAELGQRSERDLTMGDLVDFLRRSL